MAAPSRDAIVRICYGEFVVHLVAEGHSGNPDVMNDLTRRGMELFKQGIESVVESGVMDVEVVDDDE